MKENFEFCQCEIVHESSVLNAKRQMPQDDVIRSLSELFKILGDPTRIRIMCALEKGELCVCDLAQTLNMTKSAISHQLNTLRSSKLVKFRREGKNVFYSLDDQHVTDLLDIGLAHISHK